MKKLIPWVLALTAIPAFSANFFDNLANETMGGDRQNELRASYYAASKEGRRHSIESIRDYKMRQDFEENGGASVLNQAYFKYVLPYFYEGDSWSLEFKWNSQLVEVVKRQRANCLSKKSQAAKANAELIIASRTAPMGQYGQKVEPRQQISEYKGWLQAITITCKGVDPGGMNGNQVWTSLEKSVKTIKGEMRDDE